MRQAVLGIIILAVGAALAVLVFMTRGESLYDCRFQLSADKVAYRLTDVVTLTAQIVPRNARSLTVSEQLYNNIRIWNLEYGKDSAHDHGKPIRYHFTPGKPLQFQINGKFTKRDDGSLWLDFGDYGRASVRSNQSPPLRFVILPYRIPISDSVEWGSSNELQLRFDY